MSFLSLKNVSKSFGEGKDAQTILKDINLDVEQGEIVAILGFSGSGKTTLISMIAGLTAPTEGTITCGEQIVDGASPARGVVFQNYSLMPWLSVTQNVRMAVDAVFPKWRRDRKAAQVHKYVDMVGLSHAENRKPAELSGGMRQRVNVARALAIEPEVLLLDEPLSALDALTRANLQDEIAMICERERKTTVLITNDVDEAILLADRIIPLNPGPEATLGPSFDVDLERPRDRTKINHHARFVALRKGVTDYLMKAGIEQRSQAGEGPAHPSVEPKQIGMPSKRFVEAAIDNTPAKDPKVVSVKPTDRYLSFKGVTKVYPTPKGPLTVVDGFDLTMRKGEFISIIGHSGCGKSTVLTMTAGLNAITGGTIMLDGQDVTDPGPDRGVVFQAPSLFPWLSAYENVSLGVDRVYPHALKAERRDVVEHYLCRVGLGDAMTKKASELSNGMQQRVGIARAFALSPKLLLLDEPFGMLDSLTRWELQEVLMDVWTRTQVTAICVTHDVDEAILLADRVIMMTNGPNARVGKVMDVNLPRPRTRKELLSHPDYYAYREQLLTFLEEYETHKHAA
ncbi:MAG: ABC transporter ATP-binding protein [Pseudomonadota bacterium]